MIRLATMRQPMNLYRSLQDYPQERSVQSEKKTHVSVDLRHQAEGRDREKGGVQLSRIISSLEFWESNKIQPSSSIENSLQVLTVALV